MSKQRYKLVIAYRGTRYHGWQAQASAREDETPDGAGEAVDGSEEIEVEEAAVPAAPVRLPVATVQGELIRAVGHVVGHPVKVIGSSRTDAGVHAKGQIAHFDTDRTQIPAKSLRLAVNARLPQDIAVLAVVPVSDGFDAITSTRSKRYQYAIWNAPDRAPLMAEMVWHRWQKLDRDAMEAAAAQFVGTHDFASFARPGHGRSNTVRTILACEASWRSRIGVIGVEGTGFLWHMVRIMVGTIVQAGLGNVRPEEIASMISARDRTAAGPTAPAHGLYLQWIKTNEDDSGVAPPAP